MTYIWPVADALARVTQEYGANRDPQLQPGGHTGMDFKGPAGTPILAEADGVIVFADWADQLGWPNPYYIATSAIRPGGAGICVGLDVGPFQFWHAHLIRTDLNAGDHVRQGDISGYICDTCYAFGVHLHLDVLPDGWNVNSGDGRYGRVNPRDVIDGYPAVKPQGDVVLGNQRVTGPDGVRRRSAPDKNAQLLETFGADLILTFKGFVRATDPYGDGNNVWFVGALGTPTYFHSSGFTDQGTHDLADLTPKPAPVPVPPVIPDPAKPPTVYDFPLAFPVVNGITVEKLPADIGNVDTGNIAPQPGTAVCHWWNDLAHAPAFMSVIGEFRRAGSFKSAHFVVDETRIGQMVGLRDRAYHAGAGGNGWWGIEISPYATERDAAGNYTPKALRIQANVRELLLMLDGVNGKPLTLTLHKNVPGNNTSCSDLDLTTFRAVVVPPVVKPPVVFPSLDDTIRDLIEFYGN